MGEQCADSFRRREPVPEWLVESLEQPRSRLLAWTEGPDNRRPESPDHARQPRKDACRNQRGLAGARRADHVDLALPGTQAINQVIDLGIAAMEAGRIADRERPHPWVRTRHVHE